MSKKIQKKITTNSRLLSDLLTKYRNTFFAFCELINNSIQAKATEIDITVAYAKDTDVATAPIKSIKITDTGRGVSISDFENKILEVATTAKVDGQGIGRFGALQLGSKIEIETVAWDDNLQKFTKVFLPINSEDFQQKGLKDIDFTVTEEELTGNHNTYYSCTIKNLYHGSQHKVQKKNKIAPELTKENIRLAIFEKYPFQIFNDTVSFSINGSKLKREEFIHDKPKIRKLDYVDTKGNTFKVNFYFYNIKLPAHKVKVFLQVDNSGIKTVAHEYTYSSDWYSPETGTWFIYIESEMFNSDLFRNIDFEDMGDEELTKLKTFIKTTVNDFFIAINVRFEKFSAKLSEDDYNPYKDEKPASETQEYLFKKVAFLVEDQYKLIEKDNKIRGLIYPLIDKALSDGYIQNIFDKILKLDKESIEKFHQLLEKTELEHIIHFANKVSEKIEFLDFLHDLVYGKELMKIIKERSMLHKIIENELWVFGEAYNGSPCLWSDKKIGNILYEIREKTLVYEPNKEDENLIELASKELNDITDLFFTNEKITDDGCKEYMVVELKSPKCLIGQKEINQIDRYAFTIEQYDSLPADKVKYKLLLISSKLNDYAKSKLDSSYEIYRVPFLYDKKKKKNIEIYVMSWSELIENNRRKLGYLSEQLKVKDRGVKEKFETEYAELLNAKVRSVLKRIT